MIKVIGVRFRTAGKIYYFDPMDFEIRKGDNVIVETARGIEFGRTGDTANPTGPDTTRLCPHYPTRHKPALRRDRGTERRGQPQSGGDGKAQYNTRPSAKPQQAKGCRTDVGNKRTYTIQKD